jgi:CD2 antigen cytoplasmic tail-binding protein 2
VVSEEVRRRIEEAQRQAEAAAAADAAPLSATQIARLQYTAAQALQPGETVAAGLKRLGGQGRRPAKRGRRGGDDGGGAADAAPDPAAKERFQRLTEAAMKLMDAGENDVYSQTKVEAAASKLTGLFPASLHTNARSSTAAHLKPAPLLRTTDTALLLLPSHVRAASVPQEYFLRAAAVYIDVDNGEGPSNNPLAAGAGKAAYEDADEDMFASDDEKEKEQGGKAGASGDRAEAAAAPPPAGGPPGRGAAPAPAPVAAASDTTDYASWPIKELRRFLDERGVVRGRPRESCPALRLGQAGCVRVSLPQPHTDTHNIHSTPCCLPAGQHRHSRQGRAGGQGETSGGGGAGGRGPGRVHL